MRQLADVYEVMAQALIDDWLPRFDEREFHSKEIAAPPAAVERAIRALKPGDLPLTRVLMGLRTLPALLSGRRRPRVPARPLLDGVQAMGFVMLEERPGEQIVLGAAGRFWRPRGDGVDSLSGPAGVPRLRPSRQRARGVGLRARARRRRHAPLHGDAHRRH